MKVILFLLAISLIEARKLSTSGCYEGEFKNKDGNCEKCSPFCEKCDDGVGCPAGKCRAGSFHDGNGTCIACMYGCEECDNFETCKKCGDDFYMVEGNCYPDSAHCEKSDDVVGCSKCEEGYFLNNATRGKCSTCGYGCASGSNNCDPTKTEGCKAIDQSKDGVNGTEYYIFNGVATECPDHCSICYEPSKTYKEYPAHVKGSAPGCVQCEDHFYLTDLGLCLECDPICKSCTGSASNCDACNPGFNKVNVTKKNADTGKEETYKSCRPEQPFCETFDYEKAVCTKCMNDTMKSENGETGFMLVNGYCIARPPQCAEVDSTGCTKCNGSYVAVGGVCVPKPTNCAKYDDNLLCTECDELYYLVNGFCQPCDPNCVSCDGINGICTECIEGYFSNDTTVCKETTANDEADSIYWELGVNDYPLMCTEDKYIDFDNHRTTCRDCSAYCAVERLPLLTPSINDTEATQDHDYCDGTYGCTRCKPGFYVSPDGECSSCPVHCSYCDQTLGCLHCLGDTHLSHGRCAYNAASSMFTLLIVLLLAIAL